MPAALASVSPSSPPLLPTSLLAAVNASFRVAPITALIVLVPQKGQIGSPLDYALERVLEIAIGNVIGVAVAMFVFPARAHGLLTRAAATIADLNADLLTALIEGLTTLEGRPNVAAIHARIRASLKSMEGAADEATRERRGHVTDRADPEPLVRTLYRVRHDLVMVGRATAKPLARAGRDGAFALPPRPARCGRRDAEGERRHAQERHQRRAARRL